MKSHILTLLIFCSVALNAQEPYDNSEILPRGLISIDIEDYKERILDFSATKSAISLPGVIDWSESPHFPPVGNQINGSCSPWSIVYYSLTFARAKNLGVDFTGYAWEYNDAKGKYEPPLEIQANLMNPYFTYNLCNGGINNGSAIPQIMDMIETVGTNSWLDAEVYQEDLSYWPAEEDTWKMASVNRTQEGRMLSKEWGYEFEFLKELLHDSILITIPLKIADYFSDSVYITDSIPDLETNFEFNLWANHAVTIIGYNDTISYEENGEETHGAFKVVNSWGDKWGPLGNGMFYISYKTVEEKIWQLYYIKKNNYPPPSIYAAIDYSHHFKYLLEFMIEKSPDSKRMVRFYPEGMRNEVITFDGSILFELSNRWNDLLTPTNLNFNVKDNGSGLSGEIDSVYVEFDKALFDLNRNKFYGKDYHHSVNHNDNFELTVTPLFVDESIMEKQIQQGDRLSIPYETPWKNYPIKVEMSLDLYSWIPLEEYLSEDMNEIILEEDCSSPFTRFKIYFSDYPDVGYALDRWFQYRSEDEIRIVDDIELDTILISEDNPVISWSTQCEDPINIILRSDNEVFDTLARNPSGEEFHWLTEGVIPDTSLYYLQISDVNNRHFAFTKKFRIQPAVSIDKMEIESQYFIGDTLSGILKANVDSAYPIRFQVRNVTEVYEIGIIEEGGYFEWIIPDSVTYSEDNKLYFISGEDGVISEGLHPFSLIPAQVGFQIASYSNFGTLEKYSGIPAVNDSLIVLANSNVIALDPSGKILWSTHVPNCTSYSSSVFQDTVIYVSVNQVDGRNLNTFTLNGELLWNLGVHEDLFLYNHSNVSIGSDYQTISYSPLALTVSCLSSNTEKLWDFNPSDIVPLTNVNIEASLNHGCMDANDNYYFLTGKHLFKIDRNGDYLWNIEFDGYSRRSNVLVGNDQKPITVGIRSGVEKYGTNGDLIWSQDIRTSFQPVIDREDNIIISCNINYSGQTPGILCINPYGELLWSYEMQGALPGAGPVLDQNGDIYVLTTNKSLLILSETGAKRMEIELGPPIRISDNPATHRAGGCTIGPDGQIVIATVDGAIWAIRMKEPKSIAKTAWPKALNNLANQNRQSKLLRIEIDSSKSQFEKGGSIWIDIEKSNNIEQYTIAYKNRDESDNWHEIFSSPNDIASFEWDFNPQIRSDARIEIKVFDTDHPGYCDFLEYVLELSVCEELYPEFDFDSDTLKSIGIFDSYQWYNQDGKIDNATGHQYSIMESGTYFLEVTDSFGCRAISEGVYIIKTDINELEGLQLKLTIHPNPSDGKFNLKFENAKPGKYQLQLINELGQILLTKEVYIVGHVYEEVFEKLKLSDGNYFIKAFNGEHLYTKKILIK